MRIRTACAVLSLALTACSGGPSGEATFGDDKARPPASPAATGAPSQAQGVALPANLPPASMFLADGSHRTGPVRYCRDGSCADLKPPAPPALEGPAGSPVLFSLSAPPVRARLDLAKPGAAAQQISLTPGSAIAWQPQLPAGGYRLTLTAVYDTTEVSWPFALKIVPASRR